MWPPEAGRTLCVTYGPRHGPHRSSRVQCPPPRQRPSPQVHARLLPRARNGCVPSGVPCRALRGRHAPLPTPGSRCKKAWMRAGGAVRCGQGTAGQDGAPHRLVDAATRTHTHAAGGPPCPIQRLQHTTAGPPPTTHTRTRHTRCWRSMVGSDGQGRGYSWVHGRPGLQYPTHFSTHPHTHCKNHTKSHTHGLLNTGRPFTSLVTSRRCHVDRVGVTHTPIRGGGWYTVRRQQPNTGWR